MHATNRGSPTFLRPQCTALEALAQVTVSEAVVSPTVVAGGGLDVRWHFLGLLQHRHDVQLGELRMLAQRPIDARHVHCVVLAAQGQYLSFVVCIALLLHACSKTVVRKRLMISGPSALGRLAGYTAGTGS